MKVGISRFVVVAAVLGLMSTRLFAQISFPNFSSVSSLTLNGSAAQGPGNVLRVTPASLDQAGSAWFTTLQPVKGGFSTAFTFQIGGASADSIGNADGFAFVIQTMGTSALGPDGCSMGFGGNRFCQGPGAGITNSVAVEFDTFNNGIPDDNNGNHVAILSCPGMAANTTDLTAGCTVANVNLPASLADNNVHSVAITYKPATATGCEGGCPATLDVILDNKDLFGPKAFDLSTLGLIGANLDSAYVGFTAATGGGDDNQDILSWTLTPQAQSASLPAPGVPAVLAFNGGPQNNAYDYNAVLTGGGVTSATIQINPVLIGEEACEQLVQKSFPRTQCFVYQNAAGLGVDSPVLFELTCPGQPGGTCGDTGPANFFADLGSDFTFTKAENPGFQFLNSTIGPYAGWLKGSGLDPLHPCTPNPDGVTPLFATNQISSFSVTGDPLGTTKGKSGGGGSCWVATYATFGELPPGIKITMPTFKTYTHSATPGVATYACSDPKTSQPLSSPVGPYLTAATCTQNQAPSGNNTNSCSANVGGIISCTGGFDLSVKGLHVFAVKSTDTGGNLNVNFVIYFVR
jgi:hypothetical protein